MARDGAVICEGCARGIELCAFCDDAECGEAICYRCLILELGETIAQPHDHGG